MTRRSPSCARRSPPNTAGPSATVNSTRSLGGFTAACTLIRRVAKAQQTLREQPSYEWEYHRARSEADPLNYFNPFGVDSDEIRLRALVLTNQLLDTLRSRGKLVRSDHNTALRALRLWRDLANDMDGDEPDGSGGVTVSRLDQNHYG